MDIIIFLLIYLVILVAVIGFEIYVLFNNKGQYQKRHIRHWRIYVSYAIAIIQRY